MKNKKLIFYSIFIFLLILFFSNYKVYAAEPKLISTLSKAFEKIKDYIIKISTPAAAVAVGTGVLMKKFSFGDEEKIRTSKHIIRGALFSYGFILCIDLILSLIQSLLG